MGDFGLGSEAAGITSIWLGERTRNSSLTWSQNSVLFPSMTVREGRRWSQQVALNDITHEALSAIGKAMLDAKYSVALCPHSKTA